MKTATIDNVKEAASLMLLSGIDSREDFEQMEMFRMPENLGVAIVTVRIVSESTATKLLWDHCDKRNQEPHGSGAGGTG